MGLYSAPFVCSPLSFVFCFSCLSSSLFHPSPLSIGSSHMTYHTFLPVFLPSPLFFTSLLPLPSSFPLSLLLPHLPPPSPLSVILSGHMTYHYLVIISSLSSLFSLFSLSSQHQFIQSQDTTHILYIFSCYIPPSPYLPASLSLSSLPAPTPTTHLPHTSTHRVVYEGAKCEYVADEFVVEEDILYYFRVAAVNDVGIGPYSMSISYTKRKACKFWISHTGIFVVDYCDFWPVMKFSSTKSGILSTKLFLQNTVVYVVKIW